MTGVTVVVVCLTRERQTLRARCQVTDHVGRIKAVQHRTTEGTTRGAAAAIATVMKRPRVSPLLPIPATGTECSAIPRAMLIPVAVIILTQRTALTRARTVSCSRSASTGATALAFLAA